MIYLAIAIVAIVATVVVVVYATDRSPADLGWMSEQWLAEYRASRAE